MISNIPVKQKWLFGKHTKPFDFNRNEFQYYNRKRYGVYEIPYTYISLGFRPFLRATRVRRQYEFDTNCVCHSMVFVAPLLSSENRLDHRFSQRNRSVNDRMHCIYCMFIGIKPPTCERKGNRSNFDVIRTINNHVTATVRSKY